ncbi:DUF4139 domain-containing protein [candidate division KSB1 bacterium]|nr:DUF4139 domain-containing protein [candidate division KSB1 bacterium]
MRHFARFMILLWGTTLFAGDRNDIALTIYNNDLALVREQRNLQVPSGVTDVLISDVPTQIDPTSVHFISKTAPSDVAILEQNYQYDLASSDRILKKYVDNKISVFTNQDGPFQGKLLSNTHDNLTLQMADGSIKIIRMDAVIDLDFPKLPSGLLTKPTLVWKLDNTSKTTNHQTELSYLTNGMNWHAEYVAVSRDDDKKLEISSWVSIDNQSGGDYPDAHLKLVAGDVHTVQPPPMARPRYDMAVAEAKRVQPQFEEKSFFEYHMYTLQNTTTLRDKQIKQIMLFPSVETPVVKKYTYEGAANSNDVRINLEFKNSKKTGTGIPLPKGKIRVYKEDTDNNGSLEFVGEDLIDHTPIDEMVRVFLGNAFDIQGERSQKETKRISDRTRQESWEVKLRNHKKSDVTVTVIEHLWGDWSMIQHSHPYHKKNAHTIEFEISVPTDGEVTVTYTAQVTW